jgi:hypothetical protein
MNAERMLSMIGNSWKYSFKSYYFKSIVFIHLENLFLYLCYHE